MPTHRESVAAGGLVVGPGRRGEPVALAPYDPAWPERYEVMRARLAAALGEVAVRIDHVGSTAVPGLEAKPVIDVQVSVRDVTDEDAYRDTIESQGFVLRWIEAHHRYFRPPPGLPREYQVHVCSIGSEWERVHLLFRDYLRAHPETAAEYAALKASMAAQHPNDRIAYTDAKGPFIDGVVAAAAEWARQTGWRP
jgi:GrpB-like predicted nucleotidyltransferase (UPF0157 family)